MAFDGLTFKQIWNFSVANSEIISVPVPGYYNDDKVPDFMVKHQIGPGFPVYYYTTATILDGKTGKPILETPMQDTMSAQMSGLSLSVDGYGNDWFLHWSANCLGKEGSTDKYEFAKDPDSEADLCKLRFNSTMVTSLLAFSQHVQPPGLSLYNSENWQKLEYNNTVDPRKIAEEYANAHANDPSDNKYIDDRRKTIQHIQQQQEAENFYPRGNVANEEQQQQQPDRQAFVDKELDEMSDDDEGAPRNNKWEQDDNNKPRDNDVNYDYNYDEVEKRLAAVQQQLGEVRAQRSEKNISGRYINNDTNDVENQLDPSMDYTNGQSKNNNYYTNINRSNNAEENVDYMLPDIDFVDNMKDAEALDDRRRKRETRGVRKRKTNKWRNPISKIVDEYRLASLMNKRLKREDWLKPIGMQRQPPTGILVPSLTTEGKTSSDLVFSTYWIPPSSTPFVLLPRDLECVKNAEDKAPNKLSPEERQAVVSECLSKRGVDYQSYQEATDKENSRISLGQMTVYRMRLQCACPEDMLTGQTCRDISKRQSWPGFLGATGNGYFETLQASN